MQVKCLSLQQPWAWLILFGGKNVENRKWRTRHVGPVLIQASKREDRAAAEDWTLPHWEIAGAFMDMDAENVWWTYSHSLKHGRGSLGNAIGWFRLKGIDEIGYSSKGHALWRDPMQFGWRIDNPLELRFPFAVKGRLGLFDVELPDGYMPPYSENSITATAFVALLICSQLIFRL